VQGVIAAAAVSKAHFYRAFQGLPDCILATYAMAAGAALSVVEETCESSAGGSRRVPAAVTAILEFLAEEPELASVLTDPALVDVPGLVAVRESFTARLAQSLSAARRPAGSGATSYEELDLHLVRAARAWACGRLQPAVEATLVGGAGELTTLLSPPAPSP
jgi:AcrR family transcriptional regulator